MAKTREWMDAIMRSKVGASAMVILSLVYLIPRIDSFDELFITLASCLVGAIAVGLIDRRRTKRGQSSLGWWPYFFISFVAAAVVDILT